MRVVYIFLFFLVIVQTGRSQEFQEREHKPMPVEGSCKDVLEYIQTYIEVNDSLSVAHFKKYYVITTPVNYGFRRIYNSARHPVMSTGVHEERMHEAETSPDKPGKKKKETDKRFSRRCLIAFDMTVCLAGDVSLRST